MTAPLATLTLDEADLALLRELAGIGDEVGIFWPHIVGDAVERLRSYGLVQTGLWIDETRWTAIGNIPEQSRRRQVDIVRLTPAGRAFLAALPSPFERDDAARREAERLLQLYDERFVMRRDAE